MEYKIKVLYEDKNKKGQIKYAGILATDENGKAIFGTDIMIIGKSDDFYKEEISGWYANWGSFGGETIEENEMKLEVIKFAINYAKKLNKKLNKK